MSNLFFALALGLQLLGASLNPSLTPSQQQLERAWQTGYTRAEKDRDMNGALKFAQRGIGSINNKTVSWLTFEHPRLVAYRDGFNARKQHWSGDAMRTSRSHLTDLADGNLRHLRFHAQIGLYPAIRAQRIARQADPDELKDVHVVLQVGGRTYEPVAQPGDVVAVAQEGRYRYDKTVTTTRRKKDHDGKYRNEDLQIHIPVEERYTWYKGEFDVAFDLYDENASPRITDRDKEFTVIVIHHGSERRATFKLDDWLTAYEQPVETAAAPPAQSDLTDARPRRFDRKMASQLDTYVADLMKRTQVPGVAIAIVQNGKAVYSRGFGVQEQGKPERVTPRTLMMIGSTGKSMTTMMMATLVDEGKMAWDTPAVKLYPDFAVSDPSRTPEITLRDLVCNCTGIQRHDIEMLFRGDQPAAEGMIHSLRAFSFVGEFGKTFGYSNQMVGSGGYIAARAAGVGGGDLYADYLTQMQQRIFDPIGMTSTTFSFERVQANPDHATPHGLTATSAYVPISLDLEKMIRPYAPAGASWSNIQDMARYLMTQLNQGIAPNRKRMVSAENLNVTWQPGVQVSPGAYYGLGWIIATYKGQRILSHGGGTDGFSSDLTFLPDANLGIVVLSNAQNANLFCAAVRYRVLELAFGQPMQMDGILSSRMDQIKRQYQDNTARLQPLDPVAVAPYQGIYTNETLGEVRLTLQGGRLMLEAGGFTSELRNLGEATYVLWDPPLAGGRIQFTRNNPDQPAFVYDANDPDEPDQYRFTRRK